MSNRWILFLILGFLSVVTLLFFWIRLRPIDLTSLEQQQNVIAISEPTVTFVNPARGAQTPELTIVEFSDFACSHCAQLQVALDAVLRAFPNRVRVVWKNLPNPTANPESLSASIAAHCADRQGRFWEYHDLLFARQTLLSQDTYRQIADELKLDTDRFSLCLETQDTIPLIERDREEGLGLGIVATPTLFLESEQVVGVITPQALVDLVQTILDE